jgi:hypothetical protein
MECESARHNGLSAEAGSGTLKRAPHHAFLVIVDGSHSHMRCSK